MPMPHRNGLHETSAEDQHDHYDDTHDAESYAESCVHSTPDRRDRIHHPSTRNSSGDSSENPGMSQKVVI